MMSYFNIRKNEYIPTLYGFLYSFLIIGFFILSKSLRNSLFLNNFSNQDLSYLYLITPIITGFLVWIFLLFFKNISLFSKSLLFHFGICLISTYLLLNINYTNILIYYICVEFEIAIIAIIFWDVLSECFTNRQAKRLFVIITSGGFLSAVIIGTSLPFITQFINQEYCVIIFNILILACPLLVYKLSKYSFRKDSIEGNKIKIIESFRGILQNKYIHNIIFITFLFTIISVIIDYNFKIISYSLFENNTLGLTNYFARFYSITSLIAFFLQITLSGYIINRYGVQYALMILPILLLVVFISGYFFSSVIIILLLRGKQQIFKSTLHDTSMHILWMPIPSMKRLTIKPIINVILKNIFSSIAAAFLIVSVYYNLNFIHFIPIAGILLATLIFLLSRTKDFYVQELIKAIDDRSLDLSDDNSILISDDNKMLDIVKDKLINEKHNRYFILHLLDENIIDKCKKTLGELFFDSDHQTQKLMLHYLKNENHIIKSDYLIEQVNLNSPISIDCLNVLCSRKNSEIEDFNESLFKSKIVSLKFSSINNASLYNHTNKNKALEIIKKEIMTKDDSAALIEYISYDAYNFSKEEIIRILSNIDQDVFIDGLKFINDKNCDYEILELIIDNLYNGYYHHNNVISLFKRINNTVTLNFLEHKFLDKKVSTSKKIFINDVIKFIDDTSYIPIYEKYIELSEYNFELIENIFDSLIYFKRNNSKFFHSRSMQNITEKIILQQYSNIKLLGLLDNKDKYFLNEFYTNKVNTTSRILMKILYFYNDSLFSKNLQLSIFEKKMYLSKVIEIFEECLSDDLKNKVIPILDNLEISEKNSIGLSFYNKLSSITMTTLYESNTIYQDHWFTFLLLIDNLDNDRIKFEFSKIINNRYFKLLFNDLNFNKNDFLNKSKNEILYKIMITNLEKTLYLKDSSLFKDIPAKELIYVANCLNEVSLIKNTLVFKDGDIGDSMYFIIKGEIKISKGDIELVIFKKGDYFGEMSLLDGEVRSADATSLNDSILLKLDAKDFEKIMYSNDQIMKGIVGMLSQRLRDANNLLNKN